MRNAHDPSRKRSEQLIRSAEYVAECNKNSGCACPWLTSFLREATASVK